jgi:hypothetical protein
MPYPTGEPGRARCKDAEKNIPAVANRLSVALKSKN